MSLDDLIEMKDSAPLNRHLPLAICCLNWSSGGRARFATPPSQVFRQTAAGMTSIGAELAKDHLLPTVPVMPTILPCLVP